MVNLLFIEDDDMLAKPGVVRPIYDPTAGTGGMLAVAGEYLTEHNPQARLTMFGAGSGGRTRTGLTALRILSPIRLPVPSSRLGRLVYRIRAAQKKGHAASHGVAFVESASRSHVSRVAGVPLSYFFFGFHKPSAAPVGSVMMLSQPSPITSVTSFITVAPSDLAFCVAAAMSSTRT
jgi:hypothetical protein